MALSATLVNQLASASRQARAALVDESLQQTRAALKPVVEALAEQAKRWFADMPNKQWSVVAAREQGLLPQMQQAAHQFAQQAAAIMAQAVVEARRRAYLRSVNASRIGQEQAGKVFVPSPVEIITRPRRESVRIDGCVVQLLEADAEDGHWITTQTGAHVFIKGDAPAKDAQGKADSDKGTVAHGKHQAETPAFKQWFGGSKVVDAQGKPLVVYHGGTATTVFDTTRGGSGHAMFGPGAYFGGFGVAEQWANERGGSVGSYYLNLQNPFDERQQSFNDNRATAFKSLLQKAGVDNRDIADMGGRGTLVYLAGRLGKITGQDTWRAGSALNAMLRQAGYDGIVAEFQDSLQYVAFHPTQIKSATKNKGTFDPKSPSIIESAFPGLDIELHDAPEPPFPDTPKRKVVRAVLRDNDGSAITLNDPPIFPGGGIEGNESPREACVRECLEEVGQRVEVVKWLCDTEQDDAVVRYYECRGIKQREADQPEDGHWITTDSGAHVFIKGDAPRVDKPKRELPPAKAKALEKTVVRGSDGQPLRVYHGTTKVFDQFSNDAEDLEALYGPGAYFTEDPEVASGYATGGELSVVTEVPPSGSRRTLPEPGQQYAGGTVRSVTIQGDKAVIQFETPAHANVRAAYLDIKKPLRIDGKVSWDEVSHVGKLMGNPDLAAAFRLQGVEHPTGENLYVALRHRLGSNAKVNELLQRGGYDGITHIGGEITGGKRHRVWIAFEPSQVVSTFGESLDGDK